MFSSCCNRVACETSPLAFRFLGGTEINENEQYQHHQENDGGQGVHRGPYSPPHFAVDQGGQGIDPGSLGKVGDDKII